MELKFVDLYVVVLTITIRLISVQGVECYSCHGGTANSQCNAATVTCNAGEVCVTMMSENGRIKQYNKGCKLQMTEDVMNKQVCTPDMTSCSYICDYNLCNDHSLPHLLCHAACSMDHVHNCSNKIAVCDTETEACLWSEDNGMLRRGCVNKQTCSNMNRQVCNEMTSTCTYCCDTDYCNVKTDPLTCYTCDFGDSSKDCSYRTTTCDARYQGCVTEMQMGTTDLHESYHKGCSSECVGQNSQYCTTRGCSICCSNDLCNDQQLPLLFCYGTCRDDSNEHCNKRKIHCDRGRQVCMMSTAKVGSETYYTKRCASLESSYDLNEVQCEGNTCTYYCDNNFCNDEMPEHSRIAFQSPWLFVLLGGVVVAIIVIMVVVVWYYQRKNIKLIRFPILRRKLTPKPKVVPMPKQYLTPYSPWYRRWLSYLPWYNNYLPRPVTTQPLVSYTGATNPSYLRAMLNHWQSRRQVPLPGQVMYPQSRQIMYPQSGQVMYPQSGPVTYPQSGQVMYPQSGLVMYPQSGQVMYPQSGQVMYPQSGPVMYSQSGQVMYPQSGPVMYPQSGHVMYPQSGQVMYPQSGPVMYPQCGKIMYPQSGQVMYPQSYGGVQNPQIPLIRYQPHLMNSRSQLMNSQAQFHATQPLNQVGQSVKQPTNTVAIPNANSNGGWLSNIVHPLTNYLYPYWQTWPANQQHEVQQPTAQLAVNTPGETSSEEKNDLQETPSEDKHN